MIDLKLQKGNSIGVFDSGVGGVGVLKELASVLPHENFIYYGDSLHAPYGEKTPEQVFELVNNVVKHLLAQDVKVIVIACNTATSVSVNKLRRMYTDIPIIGMEPAIKKAADMDLGLDHKNRILVMATPVTLHLEKYQQLQHSLEDRAEFLSVECPGLAKRVEQANLEGEDLKELLRSLLSPYIGQADSVVLGCTHYPFVKKQIHEILGDIPLIDGGKGTARQLSRILAAHDLLNDQEGAGRIVFQSSKEDEIPIYKHLYEIYEV